ncbi:MAG: hydantoinase/oxoprolinase family protein, partial [Clostridiales bacterium]|nr:hydantoinase/oxoprolinase family protein [Clostridiales bacterium]
MALGLGIDTGGTYTDGVIYDFEASRVVAREKRLTTPHNLSRGICELLGAFEPDRIRAVDMVALSTTLATNACVEGRGGRAGLILMGYDRSLAQRLANEYGLAGAEQVHFIAGSHSQRGGVIEEVDPAEVDLVARQMAGRVDAVGVVEYWGVRDPSFEKLVKERVRAATGLPVAAAHEMTGEINSMRRAASVLVNARLIPLIDELLAAVRSALNDLGVGAPMMVVRGDGSLMTEKFAREYPVETMLSGPASSIAGAMRLSGLADMVAIDIGGTTTDLSVVRGGRARLMREGVDVGEFHTGTRAVDIHTIGLGGDSSIEWTARDGLGISPVRALPLCQLTARYPACREALAHMAAQERSVTYSRGTFFLRNRAVPPHMALAGEEQRVLGALADGPLSIEKLADALHTRPYFIRFERLERLGLVLRSTLTPTDAMHISGAFIRFDAEGSRLGAQLMASQAEMAEDALVDEVLHLAGEKLHRL